VRQIMHKTGIRPDHALGINEGVERMAVEALDELEPRRSALAGQLPEAEKERGAAFERARRQRRPSSQSARSAETSPARSSPNGGRSRTKHASGSGAATETTGWNGRKAARAAQAAREGWPKKPSHAGQGGLLRWPPVP
jgi:hypothetical protein